MLFIAIILFIVGLSMLIKPKIVWQITERWKFYSEEEPSNLYIKSIRFGGVMLVLVGVGSLIVIFIQ